MNGKIQYATSIVNLVERLLNNLSKVWLKWEARIAINPELAHQEPLLKHRDKLYRGLIVSKYNKLIFYVEEDIVYISDLWDMRREPSRLSRRLK